MKDGQEMFLELKTNTTQTEVGVEGGIRCLVAVFLRH